MKSKPWETLNREETLSFAEPANNEAVPLPPSPRGFLDSRGMGGALSRATRQRGREEEEVARERLWQSPGREGKGPAQVGRQSPDSSDLAEQGAAAPPESVFSLAELLLLRPPFPLPCTMDGRGRLRESSKASAHQKDPSGRSTLEPADR